MKNRPQTLNKIDAESSPSSEMEGLNLNLRQQRAVEAYLRDPHATRAALAAGYSPRSAYELGSKLLLRRPDVRAYIEQKEAERRHGQTQIIVNLSEPAKLRIGSAVVIRGVVTSRDSATIFIGEAKVEKTKPGEKK